MALPQIRNFTCVLSIMCGASGDLVRFIFVSKVVDLTWNIELGCQGETDRWWGGSTPLPEPETQPEILRRLSASNVRISGWKGTQDKCLLKVTFDLPQLQKLSVVLKERSSEESSRRAMCLLFEAALDTPSEQAAATSTVNFKGISSADLSNREREQTIQQLKRRISMLEKALACPPPESFPAPRKTPTIPKGASLGNPYKRRRVVKDLRFDGE
ncbi:hypothetical protein FRC07_002380 [Ceratobasidium sp. 392]|nr:hypothetical protein FRC07_002380 [Ceratobasidium sp. 392]